MADDPNFPASSNAPVGRHHREDYLIIRMWPKTPVLYPMALVALICALVAQFSGSETLNTFEPVRSIEVNVEDSSSLEAEIQEDAIDSMIEEEAPIVEETPTVEEPPVEEMEEPVADPESPVPAEDPLNTDPTTEEPTIDEPTDIPAEDPINEDPIESIEEIVPSEPETDETPSEEDGATTEDTQAKASSSPLTILRAQVDDPPVSQTTVRSAEEEMKNKRVDRTLAVIFLFVLLISLFSICVDMDVRWAVIYFSSIIIIALLIWITNIYFDFLPGVFQTLDESITPMANSKFYLGVFLVWLFLMFVSFVVTRFHYVKIEANEVIVVGGMLERQQRYSTMRMRYVKEVQDVMEYYLPFVRSGRLIISFPEHAEAIIIDNVINIKRVTKKLDAMVSSFQVVGD